MQTGCVLFIHFMCSSAFVLIVFNITVTLCIAFQGAMSFSPTGEIASSRQKICGENDGSSWCPFSVSQVIGYENVRWVSHKILY
jgi:hypothetical protein